jgi:hypothetical protein
MPTLVSPTSPQGFPFATAVRNRSWDWLLELRRRLSVEVQLVDDHATATLSQPSGHVAAALSRLLASPPNEVRTALGNAVRTRTPTAVTIERLQIACFGLAPVRDGRGVLVLARELVAGRDSVEQVRGELELIGSWLTTAIEAHLTSEPSSRREDLSQVTSLCRVLTDTARSGGSDRDLVAAFVEALAVWNDLEIFGYMATAAGEYALDVAMPGADRTYVPASLDASAVPVGSDVIYLSRSDAERLQFGTSQDVVIMSVASQDGVARWLMALVGPVEARSNIRLSLYAKLLDHWVGQLLALSESRIKLALALQLLPVQDRPEAAVADALEELTSAVGGDAAAVIVTLNNGMEWLRVGNPELFVPGSGGAARQPERVVVVRRAPGRCTTALAVAGSGGRPFSRAAAAQVDAAVDVVHSWTVSVLGRGSAWAERRAGSSGFVEAIERLADRAAADGTPVAFAMLSAADGRFRPTSMIQQWVASMRSSVRPRDLVGIVGEGEIGVLLYDSGEGAADLVVARLRSRIAESSSIETSNIAVGIAVKSPDASAAGSLLERARRDAAARSSSPIDDLSEPR